MVGRFEDPVKPSKDNAGLRFFYGTAVGRIFVFLVSSRFFSGLVGAFLRTPLSKPFIKPFVKRTNINLSDFEKSEFTSFNDFFCRKIKAGKRPVAEGENAVVSPCDSNLSVYKIKEGGVYPVKQSEYTVYSLLKNEELAKEYENGYIFVFRLCVENYHRYIYSVSGDKSKNTHIKGKLHTIRPIALYRRPVFCENSREYTVIETENFGRVIQMEIGAMLVGKINNFHEEKTVFKGEEKGHFLYGGSTVILLFKEGEIEPCPELIKNTNDKLETPVKQGEQINIVS